MTRPTLETLRDLLPIDKYSLDTELERHGEIFENIGRELTMAKGHVEGAAEELAQIEARLSQNLTEYSQTRQTRDQITAQIVRNRDRVAAWERWHEAKSESEQWAHLHEAWRARGYALSKLVELYTANYFSMEVRTRRSNTREPLGSARRKLTQGDA